MSWWKEFPAIGGDNMRLLKKVVDGSFRDFTRAYGEVVESFFEPLRYFLIATEKLFISTPWPIVMAVIGVIAWWTTRSIKMLIATMVAFALIGMVGLWDDTMRTLSIIIVATGVTLAIGLPLGIALSKSNRLQFIVNPIMDIMQTLPSFVYLIPIVMLLGIGRVPGIIAVIIYSIPPVIRFTNLGIRLVSQDVLEAADAFGATVWQKLFQVQFPLALPTIMAGINQTIMLALGMVVIAAMIGVEGLGQKVLRSINNQYFTLGLLNGLAIVVIAIVLDRMTQLYGKRIQKHIEVQHG